MNRPPQALLYVCRLLLWTASWLVPQGSRAEWHKKRDAQIWHWIHFLAESGGLSRESQREVLRHCWGAFPDALWRRFDREKTLQRLDRIVRAPAFCLGTLGAVLLVVVLVTGFAPTVRSLVTSPYSDPGSLFAVRPAGRFMWFRSDKLLRVTDVWKGSPLVKGIAAYSFESGTLSGARGEVSVLSGQVAPNFFDVLGVRAAMGRTFRPSDLQDCKHCVVLSGTAWKTHFHGAPEIVGRRIRLNGEEAKVIGVLPRQFSFISPRVAAWSLFDPSAPVFANMVDRMGAVARLASPVTEEQASRELQRVTDIAGYHFVNTSLQVASLKEQARQDVDSYLFFLLLAALGSALVAWTAKVRGNFAQLSAGLHNKYRWWGFFAAKAVLGLAIAFVSALEITYCASVLLTGTVEPLSNLVSVWVFLMFAIGALSWAIHDQRRRCRVCLQRLGLSVHVGCPGYTLLDCWAATELVCANGHGMLYMPDSESSCLEGDQWSSLDTSLAGISEPRQPV